MPQYAQELFGGKDAKDTVFRKGRLPLPALTSAKEQEIVRRILARRERIVMELTEIVDELLPKEQINVGLEETGWTIRSNRPPWRSKTGRSNKKTGGEKPK